MVGISSAESPIRQGVAVGKKWKRVMLAALLYLFWTVWHKRNRMVFGNESPSAHKMMSTYISNLWSRENVYNADDAKSLQEFLSWLGCS